MLLRTELPTNRLTVLSQARPIDRLSEIAAGLAASQASLPAWFLYDDAGSTLFDRICETPEYYPTRTERALLAAVAPDIARRTRADESLEFGSGHARKTYLLLDALGARERPFLYRPFDVSEVALEASAKQFAARYAQLSIHGLVGDFTGELGNIPPGERRLVAFLGGTIGNFDVEQSRDFLRRIAGLMGPEDWFLLAADLVKDRSTLHSAYNDRAGVTAEFNLNALARLRSELRIELEVGDFRHDAFFDETHSRIEMHARAVRPTTLFAGRMGVSRRLAAGESIRTEISRKFTRTELEAMHVGAGLHVEACYVADVPYALILSRRL